MYRGICDMRRSFDRLARMVEEELEQDPLSGDVFVFLNREQTRMKCLYWEHGGYVIWYKRLEVGKFVCSQAGGIELDRLGWTHLLEGIEAKVIRRQPRYGVPDGKKLK
jgi:transposase